MPTEARSGSRTWPAAWLLAGGLVAGGDVEARILSFAERVAAQRAIEGVYWNRRIWPAENPTPKPPLSAVMSDAALRARVEDLLRKSNALDAWWKRPVTSEQLQAEMERMAAQSRDPDALRELFAALGNDPFVIAETLARQALVERLIRNWYANDERFHGALKREVRAALRSCATAACMPALGGEYRETTWALRRADDAAARPDDGTAVLDPEDWREHLDRLTRRLGGAPEALPLQSVGALEETNDGLVVTAVLDQAEGRVTTATVSWPKVTFDAWWKRERESHAPRVAERSGAFALQFLRALGCDPDTWTSIAALPPARQPRYEHTAVWTGAEMIVWGGIGHGTGNEFLATGGRYAPATDTWLPTSTGLGTPAGRHGHTAVWTGTEMIVWGGTVGDYNWTNSGGRYDPSTDTWAPTSTSAGVPTALYSHIAVWTGTELIVWGAGPLGTVAGGRYAPSSDTWSPTSAGPGTPSWRTNHTAVWTGTEMIVWGGNGSGLVNTGGRYDPSSDTWSPTSTGPGTPSGRDYHTAVWTGAEMIVWGGRGALSTGGRYDPSSNMWLPTSVAAGVPVGRREHTAVWTGTEMIVWGGIGSGSSVLGTGGRYDPAADAWTPTSVGPSVPRLSHTAVWTGVEMLIWGGLESSGTPAETGGRYDPSTNTWVPLETPGLPGRRSGHTAIWTGAEMIVWGGQFGSIGLDTGARYDLALDTWTATSSGADVPSPRNLHTAVWTGTQMIVWGGFSPATNTGGRYDPTNDAWTATSTGTGVPAARGYHTAVWTGTEMIVWGGMVNFAASATGGRYDPALDAWTETSTGANAAAPRTRHTAVWTGTEMIVWGGVGAGFQHTGARYDPENDSWTLTSTGAGVPQPRIRHTAVWTGMEMIVWGGEDDVYAFGTGGRYDPLADTWIPTSTGLDAPGPRAGHSAVWTGAKMIVWGGGDNTGGLYNPRTDTWMPTSTGTDVPTGRSGHTAVWTGNEMILSGGAVDFESGTSSRYCGCAAPAPVGPTLRLARVESGTALSWSPDSGASWNVYRGSIVPEEPWSYNETCFAAGLALPETVDSDVPSVGRVFYYLVGAVDACGESAIGQSSDAGHFASPGCV